MFSTIYTRPVLVNPTKHAFDCDLASLRQPLSAAFSSVGNNTGNMAFLTAILQTIDRVLPIDQRRLADADVKIWGCSNFLATNREIKVSDSPIYRDGTPLVAIGLGAQGSLRGEIYTLPEATAQWIRTIRALRPNGNPNISVRGQYTFNILEANGLADGVVVIGCPSHFISPNPHLGESISNKLKSDTHRFIGIAPANPLSLSNKLLEIDSWLLEIINRHDGSILVQHPYELWQLAAGNSDEIDLISLEKIRQSIASNHALDSFLTWYKTRARIFYNIPSWLLHLRSLDLVLSMRIHGTQLALQSGTPALCIAIDSRQVELCETMKIPFIPMSSFSVSMSLSDVIEYLRNHDWAVFDQNRRRMAADYASFLNRNGLIPSSHLLALAGDCDRPDDDQIKKTIGA
jgi:hypothetical protein